MLYFLLGILSGWAFWELCERRANRGLMCINPITFFIMLIWGSSGFFLLRLLSENRFSSILQFFYLAIPDWDIPLYSWTNWDFLIHRSYLFSSTILPIAYIGSSWLLSKFRKQSSLNLNSLSLNIVIGLSVGMSAHLLADVFLNLILYGKDLTLFLLNPILHKDYPYRDFRFEIGDMGAIQSLTWAGSFLVLGLVIPFYTLKLASRRN